ncbi:RNA polymerase-associated protein RapA [Aidingimonas halophila]|uniref:RNA polymerase-associated protein RapA n=1 Tax=Aidingimonas halophila TaxID=574349 RepID=A0A1H3HL98_9GAMM|nr:RNA polymerase-associated protein RapA [Aidingimonas halophila]GHC37134.1 RNA polymerase-associated protein RapA [Aidingimonas halophila]SDY15578.1 ATP-dependent helicase HepA [Aidingimonas halophila]
MSDFSPGQRWISDGEAELGLGTILNCDNRIVTVLFPASEETRTYSVRQAPLTRVVFGSGDRIQSADGWQLIVDDSKESDGLLIYIGQDDQGQWQELPETQLADTMQFDQARDRLLTGQVDRNDWFNLRFQTLQQHQRIERNPALGFTGPKVDLIPHQLYIADEVANRHAPRVLLADEVGLGKTIEAGLILHRLLLTGRAERALILVPDSLTHQWLVELLRRFALDVTLLDEQQSQAYDSTNPFEAGQLILASQQWLFANPHRQQQAEDSDWDLLIVDEAHHLDWAPDHAGPGYTCVERMAASIPGILLLTATPEQMGLTSHFARLRLLDPDRYHDLEQFKEEEQGYVQVAEAIEILDRLSEAGHSPLPPNDREAIAAVIDDPDSQALLETLDDPERGPQQHAVANTQLRDQLLDRHGTGRVMFRNSRRHVAGFPERRLHVSELDAPSPYRHLLRRIARDEDTLDELLIATGLDYPDAVLYPDIMYRHMNSTSLEAQPWWRFDPRVNWLLEQLEAARDADDGGKILVITHHRETALDLAEGLRVVGGIHAPVFHESMTLVERDRAAAAFADDESGCQLLICSEIGSEGRNFQFCHRLVMFDLPPHPDLLEQRIGRLDRIGQQHAIDLLVPVFKASPGERLLCWYRDGMNAFGAPTGIGSELHDVFGDALADALLDAEGLQEIIEETWTMYQTRLDERDAGRHRLLERNAYRPERAQQVISAINELDEDPALPDYLDRALDVFGIDDVTLGNELVHLQPGPQMLDGLPGLTKGEEGFTATVSRQAALARDDVQHLSWEHPLLREIMGRILTGTMGNTAVALLAHPAIPAGRLMAELIFRTHCPAPKSLHINRFLPATAVRVLLDESGTNLSGSVSFHGLAKNLQKVKKAVARDLIRSRHDQLRELLFKGEQEAERELPSIVEAAQTRMREALDGELIRLQALARHNPSVRPDELQSLRNERSALNDAIENTRLRLDAVRVIVTVDKDKR